MARAKVTGINDAKRNFANLIGDIEGKKAVRAITMALIEGATQAALYTPIATSTLLIASIAKWKCVGAFLLVRLGIRLTMQPRLMTQLFDKNSGVPQPKRNS